MHKSGTANSASDKRTFARRLRREAPFTEKLVWHRLRGGQIGGIKFRRQHPIGPYIVDFYCAEFSLVIELDGASHDERERYDMARDAHLQSLGLSVVRFTNGQVLDDIDSVIAAIAQQCGVGL
jgi:very-short-patch-repair endonuclease